MKSLSYLESKVSRVRSILECFHNGEIRASGMINRWKRGRSSGGDKTSSGTKILRFNTPIIRSSISDRSCKFRKITRSSKKRMR